MNPIFCLVFITIKVSKLIFNLKYLHIVIALQNFAFEVHLFGSHIITQPALFRIEISVPAGS